MARAVPRGSADRVRVRPGRGRPSRGPSSHGPSRRDAIRRAAYSNSAGRVRNAWTSHETASLARNRRVIARSYASKASRRPRARAPMAAAASSAETSARWSPSPVNGSRNPAASPTSSHRRPARRDTRWPTGHAPATLSSGAPSRHPAGSSSAAGMPATIRSATARAPSRAVSSCQERPSTIPTLTRPPGTGAIPT